MIDTDATALPESFDFIVCGAGSSGCVVAARLAELTDVRVLLVEAGGDDDVADVQLPARWTSNLGSERDWNFSAEPNPHVNGRAIPLNMGRVLGGGSSINVMVWARGHQADWDRFAELVGDPAWNYASVLSIYRRIEDWHGEQDLARRGIGGPVHVETAQHPRPIASAMVASAGELGLPTFNSPNGAMMEGKGGAAINDLIVQNGRRRSIYRSYIGRARPENLTVLTGALVSRILFRGTSAVGVEIVCGTGKRIFEARHEIVLSLGAIQTPKVLLQSGLGPSAELRRHGIAPVADLPGVGQNHQDHVSFGCIFETWRPIDVGNGGSEATLYWKTDNALDRPDLFHCQVEFPVPTPETTVRGVPAHGWTMFAGLAHPKSRGTVRLSGPEVTDRVLIEANTLSHPDDVRTAIASIGLAREVGLGAPFKDLVRREAVPGPLDARAMVEFARNAAVTYWHQACTAKMGRDEASVVDSRLVVHGIEKLRIADASVLPELPSGNTMAPCVVIGERAAQLLRAQHGP